MAYLYGKILRLKFMANNYGLMLWRIYMANHCGKLLGLKIRPYCYGK
jgi:hypothetical protein